MLPASPPTRRTLFWRLGIVIVLAVVTVLGGYVLHNYLVLRQRMIDTMMRDAQLSISSLQKNVAPFIEAYAVNEYENLVSTEIGLRKHHAIVIEDFRMGAILGGKSHITGKLQQASGQFIDFEPDNPEHQREIAQAFQRTSAPILSPSGETIGQVSVYATDQAMRKELSHVLQETLTVAAFTALLLISLLSFFLHRLFVRPLSRIADVLAQRDKDGLPTAPVPDFGYREIAVLSDAMNAMVETIRTSRDGLLVERTRLQNVIDGTNAGTWEWNIQTGKTVFNERWAEILGYTLADLQPTTIQTWQGLVHPEDILQSRLALEKHFAGETPYYESEARMRHKDGHWIWVLDRGRVSSRTESGEPLSMFGTHIDVTFIKEYQARLEHIAHFDPLTGLANRALLADRLRQAMVQTPRRESLLAVVYLDLDGFKAVNDLHGHEVGDRLLVHLANQMKAVLRDGDTLARLGGDEFVAILLDLKCQKDSQPVIQRLLDTASEPAHVDSLNLRVSASLGVAFYPQQEDIDPDQLLRQADQAMYQAKQSGKNRVHFFDAESERLLRNRHENIQRIRAALDQDEFVLYYQPKVNMRTGRTVGVEALIRWRHPERGLLSPATFLPMINGHALTIEVGEWVLRNALTQIEQWRAAGIPLPISVNIDAMQLQHPEFIERLAAELKRHPGVETGDLQLEVLETLALEDFVMVSDVMQACQELGVSFALDDFGTGYSSLTYLRRLPAQQLKIDQSFVRDMLDDPDDLAILDGVLSLAGAFRLDIIAEGVETLEHGETLLLMGCELGQGYAIARPMPGEDIPGWLAGWRPDAGWQDCHPLSRDDIPILFAIVEHRAWSKALEHYLRHDLDTPPSLDGHQCRLGQWLEHQAAQRYADHPAMSQIVAIHAEIHECARKLSSLRQAGHPDPATAPLLGTLQTLSRELLALLHRLPHRTTYRGPLH